MSKNIIPFTSPNRPFMNHHYIHAHDKHSGGISPVSRGTILLALEKEAEVAKRNPGQARLFNPPSWMRSECLHGARNSIGAEVKKYYGLKEITVVDGCVRIVA